MSRTIRHTIDLPGTAMEVYRAISDERQLVKWLTEHARVSLDEGRYELWGRYLPGAPQAPVTRLVEAKENSALRFIWSYAGRDLAVSMELKDAPYGSRLTLTQEAVTRPETEASLSDFWGLAFENLRRLAGGGSGPVFCDFSSPKLDQAVITAEIGGTAERVFDALINPAQLDRYIASKATVEPRAGGRFDYGWNGGPIKILEVVPNRQLSIAWQYGDDPETVVTWTLEGSRGGTRLTLVHSGFGARRKTDDYTTGWYHFVNCLKSMIETGPSWRVQKPESVDYETAAR